MRSKLNLLNIKKTLAFTLAEVLITLGIIGVVAEMTIPTLVQSFQRQVYISQLKRSSALLNQVYMSVLNDNGDPTTWKVTCINDIANVFIPYFQTALTDSPAGGNYGTPGAGNPMGYKNNNLVQDLTKTTAGLYFYPQIKLKSGETLLFDFFSTPTTGLPCGSSTNNTPVCFFIHVDVNGIAQPNRWGVDIFGFQATKNAIIPLESMNAHINPGDTYCETTPQGAIWGWNGNGCGCTNHVLTTGDMDYLKCIDEGKSSYCHHY